MNVTGDLQEEPLAHEDCMNIKSLAPSTGERDLSAARAAARAAARPVQAAAMSCQL